MTKLNQLVAIEGGEKNRVNKETAPLFHAAKTAVLFGGLTKTYEPAEEDGESLPAESAKVQITVGELLEVFARENTRLLDLSSTKEDANTRARADVRLPDGTVLIEGACIGFLLPFEKFLQQEVRGLVVSLPVLDPAQDWSPSATEREGVQETPTVKRARMKKVNDVITLAPPTDKHPAQVQLVAKDVVAGHWSEKKFSGAVSASRRAELLERVDELINAVKYAREECNSIEVSDKPVGARVFGYLFA